MLLVFVLSIISAFGYQTLDQEEALQNLREGNFDVILDIRALEDFETLRLHNAYHLGSLMRRRHGHRDRESESDSSSDEERPQNGERPPLEAHMQRLHGCEESRIAVHSMGGETNIGAIFSTTEVASKLSELGFNNVFDLGDISIAREHEDIPKASGERTGRCRPECVSRRHHGHHGHSRPQPNNESQNGEEGVLGMNSEYRHRSRHRRTDGQMSSESSSSESTQEVLTSFARYFGITFGAFVLVAMLYCMYRKHYMKREARMRVEPQHNEGIQQGSGEGSFAVPVNASQTGSPIETINGSPEGFGETTELPPSFEEVYKSVQDSKQYATLTE